MKTLKFYKTLIIAGIVLMSGVSHADVTSTVNQLADLNCGSGQVPVFTGSNWACGYSSLPKGQASVLADQYKACSDSRFKIEVNRMETYPSWISSCGDIQSAIGTPTNLFLANKAVIATLFGLPTFTAAFSGEYLSGIQDIHIDPVFLKQSITMRVSFATTDKYSQQWAEDWLTRDRKFKYIDISLKDSFGRVRRGYRFKNCLPDSLGRTSDNSVLNISCRAFYGESIFRIYGNAQREVTELFGQAFEGSLQEADVNVIYMDDYGENEVSVSNHRLYPLGYIFPTINKKTGSFNETFIMTNQDPNYIK